MTMKLGYIALKVYEHFNALGISVLRGVITIKVANCLACWSENIFQTFFTHACACLRVVKLLRSVQGYFFVECQ
jgi:hypothetical protein